MDSEVSVHNQPAPLQWACIEEEPKRDRGGYSSCGKQRQKEDGSRNKIDPSKVCPQLSTSSNQNPPSTVSSNPNSSFSSSWAHWRVRRVCIKLESALYNHFSTEPLSGNQLQHMKLWEVFHSQATISLSRSPTLLALYTCEGAPCCIHAENKWKILVSAENRVSSFVGDLESEWPWG